MSWRFTEDNGLHSLYYCAQFSNHYSDISTSQSHLSCGVTKEMNRYAS